MPSLDVFLERFRNPKELLDRFGETLLADIQTGFVIETDPNGSPWQPLSPVTIAKKRGLGILRESGALFNSIDIAFEGDTSVSVGPTGNLEYEVIHQKGGRSGRNRQTIIPQRAYVGLSTTGLDQLRFDILAFWFDE